MDTAEHRRKRYGLEGLGYWRQDVPAAVSIAFVALPFNLAIASVARVPPMAAIGCYLVCSIIAIIMGGEEGPFLTVGGIAAGLAPLIQGGVSQLGQGDDDRGYGLVLVSGVICGVIMTIFTLLRGAGIIGRMSHAVIDGMLFTIGVNVMLKVTYWMMGVRPHGHTPSELFMGLVTQAHGSNGSVLIVSFVTLVISIVYPHLFPKGKDGWMNKIPEQAVAVAVATALAIVLGVKGQFLLHVTGDLRGAFRLPSFGLLLANPSQWGRVVLLGVSLAFVASAESLTTVAAVDKASGTRANLDWALFISAIQNVGCALVGLPASIFGGIKSLANVLAGAKTLWSAVFSAVIVTVLCVFCTSVVNLLPMAALGAVVWLTGCKLAHPKKAVEVLKQGRREFMAYVVTAAVGLTEDLFWGIVAGLVFDLVTKFLAEQLQSRRSLLLR